MVVSFPAQVFDPGSGKRTYGQNAKSYLSHIGLGSFVKVVVPTRILRNKFVPQKLASSRHTGRRPPWWYKTLSFPHTSVYCTLRV